VGCGQAVDYQISNSRVMMRNFYSVLKTREMDDPTPFRSLVHGGIMHGGQLMDPQYRMRPSSYFGTTSGYGRMFASLPDTPRKVGIIGLGAGSIIAYARKGDTFRFYEINPQVVDVAKREFTFMQDTPAKIEVVLGDGRLSLEREPGQQFDVLAMDAFSGDSIPMHLLTRQAMEIYLRHLKPAGARVPGDQPVHQHRAHRRQPGRRIRACRRAGVGYSGKYGRRRLLDFQHDQVLVTPTAGCSKRSPSAASRRKFPCRQAFACGRTTSTTSCAS